MMPSERQTAPLSAEIPEHALVIDAQMRPFLRRNTRHEVIEDVEVPLAARNAGNAPSLEVVVEDLDTAYPALGRELKLGVLAVPGGIGIEQGPSVAEGFEYVLGSGNR